MFLYEIDYYWLMVKKTWKFFTTWQKHSTKTTKACKSSQPKQMRNYKPWLHRGDSKCIKEDSFIFPPLYFLCPSLHIVSSTLPSSSFISYFHLFFSLCFLHPSSNLVSTLNPLFPLPLFQVDHAMTSLKF